MAYTDPRSVEELQYELDGLTADQEAYLAEGNRGAAEEIEIEIQEICAIIEQKEVDLYGW